MFARVAIRASELDASARFFGLVLPQLGVEAEPGELAVVQATEREPATRGLHMGMAAASRAHVDAFWQAGVDAGFASDGEPGLRPEYADDYYGAFLLDPDGNSIEAVHSGGLRQGGLIDHLWIRVQHAGMTRRFYEATAAQAGAGEGAGFLLVASEERLARFRGAGGASFTVVEGPEPTVGLDMTIGAARFLDDDGRSLKLRAIED